MPLIFLLSAGVLLSAADEFGEKRKEFTENYDRFGLVYGGKNRFI